VKRGGKMREVEGKDRIRNGRGVGKRNE